MMDPRTRPGGSHSPLALIEVIRHRSQNRAVAAVRTGIRAGLDHGCDILVKFDADLQHDPHDIIAVIEPLLKNDADIVYGNRFNRLEYRMPLIRRAGNMVFTWLMRRLTGWPILDSQPQAYLLSTKNIWRLLTCRETTIIRSTY